MGQINTFTYLGCKISFEKENDMASKIRNVYKFCEFQTMF
jgi:hypothetical protein